MLNERLWYQKLTLELHSAVYSSFHIASCQAICDAVALLKASYDHETGPVWRVRGPSLRKTIAQMCQIHALRFRKKQERRLVEVRVEEGIFSPPRTGRPPSQVGSQAGVDKKSHVSVSTTGVGGEGQYYLCQ